MMPGMILQWDNQDICMYPSSACLINLFSPLALEGNHPHPPKYILALCERPMLPGENHYL